MPPNRLRTLLAAVAGPPPADGLADAVLLARFADAKDEAAFEALVWRHGPMVRAVCRHALGARPEADDAFQATFLVLARKAHAVRAREALGGWLYTIAGRVARKLRRQLARREATVEDLTMVPDQNLTGGLRPPLAEAADLRAVLDEEIGRLPEKYRIVVQLCYAAGHSTAEAALRLGVPKGTVLTRLAWARRRLQDRLARRGVTAGTGALGAALGGNAAGLDPQLVRATVRAATALAVGPATGSLISNPTLHLSEGVIRDMAMTKLKLTVGALVVFVAAAGVGVGRWAAPATASATASADDTPATKKKADPPRKPVPALPLPEEELPADREPTADKYAEAMRKVERLEKELEKLRQEAKRTAPVDPLLPPLPNANPPSLEALPLGPPMANIPVPQLPTPQPEDLALPRPVDPPIIPTSPAPTPSIEVPQSSPPRAGKQFTVSGPAGTWNRVVGEHRFSLKFEADRLTATNTVSTEHGPVAVTIEADFSVNRDGIVFGYITGIDHPEGAADLDAFVDTPFSFRCRTDGGVLTIKDVKLGGPTVPAEGGARLQGHDAVLFVAGRYTDQPPPTQPRVVPPAVRPSNPLIPQQKVVPPLPDVPPPKRPMSRETPPPPRVPPANRPPMDDDPAAPPITAGEPSITLPNPGYLTPRPQNFPPDRAADPFRRPDGSSRLLGPGRATILMPPGNEN